MDQLSQQPLTLCTVKAALAAGTTTTLTNTGTIAFCIKGKAYSKAAMTNATTPTADAATGATFVAVGVNKGSVFVIGLDAAGALKVTQGKITDLDSSGAFITAPEFGPVPSSVCPIGYLVTKVGATGSPWTFGASNLAGPPTGVTHTFVDLMTMPERPQVS
jgi:hypothetical protein